MAEEATSSKGNGPLAKKARTSVYTDTNAMPRDTEGRVCHLGLKDGDLANRVVVVGSTGRAQLLSAFLEPESADTPLFTVTSGRGFTTYTGLFEGRRISIMAIGMGIAMADFFVREARAIVKGPMAVARLGTCGALRQQAGVGQVAVANGAVLVQRNVDAFRADGTRDANAQPYRISKMCSADEALTAKLLSSLREIVGAERVAEGANATTDSFYCSQGRLDPNFEDGNEDIVEELRRRVPSVITMEMESFQLLHLARCAKPAGSLRATACAITLANRPTGQVIEEQLMRQLEQDAGKAVLKAMADLELD